MTDTAKLSVASPRRRAGALPAFTWLRSYTMPLFRADLMAGITLAAFILPSSIGTASLANLPPEAGLYACLFSGLLFWLFCSSKQTSITVTSPISLLVGLSLGDLAGGDVSRFGALAAGLALITAAIAFVAWLVRAGTVINFVSETVMVGFKTGVACQLASTQLPKLFGFKGTEGNFWQRMIYFFRHVGESNPTSLTLGVGALVVLILGNIFLKNRPISLLVVIAGIVVTPLLHLEARGVSLLGTVPQGLPVPTLPAVHLSELDNLWPVALACFMLGAVETAAIGRTFAAKHGGRFDCNQEFLALSMANLASGFTRGLPVSGGMSQSLVNESAGARSAFSTFIASIFILLAILFLSGLLRDLPQPVLAAIVLVAVIGLFKIAELRHLWHAHRGEFVVAICALLGVLNTGLLRGVLIGSVISLVLLLRRASRPHVAILGRIPGTRRFSDFTRNSDNELIPSILIFRPEASLLYFNVEHVCSTVVDKVHAEAPPPKLVLADLSASPHVDLQGAEALESMSKELAGAGIKFQVVEARAKVRDMLRGEGLDEKFGGINRFTSVADAVEHFQKKSELKP